MLKPRLGGAPRGRRPGLGLLLLGTGRPAGLLQFGNDPEAYLGSLAPLLALQIVTGLLLGLDAGVVTGTIFFLMMVCNLLMPPVIGHALCRWFGCLARWPLYANVLNWSVWLMLLVLVLLLPFAHVMLTFGVPSSAAVGLLFVVLTLYVLWYHWFLARNALGLSKGRALLVMAAVVFGTGLILQVPVWVGNATGLQPISDMPLTSEFPPSAPDGAAKGSTP